MVRTIWQYIIGGLFTVGFVIVLDQLYLQRQEGSALLGFGALMAGGLLLTAVLPQIKEFVIGPKGISAKLIELKKQVDEQQALIEQLVETFISPEVFRHLAGVALLHQYKYWQNDNVGELFQREFYFLKIRGFIGPREQEFYAKMDGENLVGKVQLTDIGRAYLKMRRDLVPSEWLKPAGRNNLDTEVARSLGLNLD